VAERRELLGHEAIADLAAGYVLDALSPAEMDQVREHLATCRLSHPELEELGSVVPAIARSMPDVTAPTALGERILAAARAEAATQADATAAAAAMPTAEPAAGDQSRRRVVDADPSAARPFGFLANLRRPAWALAAVAVVLAIVLGAWNLQLQSQVSDLVAYRAAVAAVVDAASASGAQVAVLTSGSAGGPSGLAAVDPSGRLVIAMRDLPATTGSEVYEAWLIGSDGTPRPAGSFAVGSAGTGTLTSSVTTGETGVVVALTREPASGATTPTLPIVVKGSAHPSSG
jgi:hypothetical protein